MSKRKRSAVWTCRLLYLLAVTVCLLNVGVIKLLLYLHLVSYRIVSISISPIPSGQILGIISILCLLVSPITTRPSNHWSCRKCVIDSNPIVA